MSEFEHHHRARSPIVLSGALLFAGLGGAGALYAEGASMLIGIGFVLVGALMAYSAWKKEEWHLQVASGVLTWSYPKSWAPASGRLTLSEVASAEINDDLSIPAATLTLKKGETTKLLLAGSGHDLSQYLASHYPQLPVHYVPSRSSG